MTIRPLEIGSGRFAVVPIRSYEELRAVYGDEFARNWGQVFRVVMPPLGRAALGLREEIEAWQGSEGLL